MVLTEIIPAKKLIETETGTVRFSGPIVSHRTKVGKGVSLVVTYHPLLKPFGNIIYDNLYLLYMNEELKYVFTPGAIVSIRRTSKISSYLVRVKLYPV